MQNKRACGLRPQDWLRKWCGGRGKWKWAKGVVEEYVAVVARDEQYSRASSETRSKI